MSQAVAEPPVDLYDLAEIARKVRAQASLLVTEDDEPVDNLYCDVQQRFLVAALHASWMPPPHPDEPEAARPFLANANVAVYHGLRQPPLVPDVFLSVDADIGPDWPQTKEPRCYFIWEFGKPPDVCLEIVSNKIGHELGRKLRLYARARVPYYVVYDPWLNLSRQRIRVYELVSGQYQLREDNFMPELGLGVTLWRGSFENLNAEWLRWCDAAGNLLLTGKERAAQATAQAEHEASRAEREASRAERLAAQLRALGIEPEADE